MNKVALEELMAMLAGGEFLLFDDAGLDYGNAVETMMGQVVVVDFVLIGKRRDSTNQTLDVDPCGCAGVEGLEDTWDGRLRRG